jgi:hypothetical protein
MLKNPAEYESDTSGQNSPTFLPKFLLLRYYVKEKRNVLVESARIARGLCDGLITHPKEYYRVCV